MSKLKTVVDIEKPHVIVVSKAWLTSGVFDNTIQLTDILPSRADIQNCRGGEGYLYAKSTLTI